MRRKIGKDVLLVLILLVFSTLSARAGILRGHVTDQKTGDALAGAMLAIRNNATSALVGTETDASGNYTIQLQAGNYTVTLLYIGYKDVQTQIRLGGSNSEQELNLQMTPDEQQLSGVVVTGTARKNSELAQINATRLSSLVQSGVSSQMIERTGDKDASEVIRRVPGVSIIDERFVMVRGLSQRYNNVWLNGSAVPSSEADSRAFSFDILPSSQIDNMVVVKSPAPEYPADFTGGFILIDTKQESSRNGLNINLSLGWNDKTHFQDFTSSRGSHSDLLGFDTSVRPLRSGINTNLSHYAGYNTRIDPIASGLNNDWTLHKRSPWGDLKLGASYSHIWKLHSGADLGLLASLNYGNTYKTIRDMENSLYGPYDLRSDKSVALRSGKDNQYSNDVRLGALVNLFFLPRNSHHRFEWKNIFNQTGKDRYSFRNGFNAQSDAVNNSEYFYSSRSTYNTQFTGKHNYENDRIDWSVGYALASHKQPDRRMIERTDRTDDRMGIYRISREFTDLQEHIASLGGNYRHDFHFGEFEPSLKTGIYGEYRTRDYRARELQYGWQPDNSLPRDFMFDPDVPNNVLIDSNYAPDKLYLYEEVNYLNSYAGHQTLLSGYLGLNLPWKKFELYLGARYEFCRQALDLNTLQYQESRQRTNYDYSDIFPSANLVWRITKEHQLRLGYGQSVNRPEFRELSPSVYFDFELGSAVMGNYDLKAAYIHNFDLRYEYYPAKGEQISVALFYKRFSNPIEWTYTVAGGTDLIYSYLNAKGADNYGVEVDIRKNLDFIGLRDFSLSVNAAFIKSHVRFPEGTNNIDRPMQGQSPYLINAGLFYNGSSNGWSAAILYNRIGKRIVGVGNRYGVAEGGESRNIPNSYEMPRNCIDLSVGKKISNWQIKLSVRDLLAESYKSKQFEKVTTQGKSHTVEETTKSYKPGRNISITLGYSF